MSLGLKFLGTGSALPAKVLTNAELETMVATSDQWITERTGIKERRIAGPLEATSDFSTQAARRAIENAGLSPRDIDLIVVSTCTPDHLFPSVACLVQRNLDIPNAMAFDVSAACSGFIYGLAAVRGFLESGMAKTALLIGADTLSKFTDWTDRGTCVLFGDGAGAMVLGPAQGETGILDTFIKSDGRLTSLLCMIGGGTRVPFEVAVAEKMFHIDMQGPEVFKHAVTAMGDAAAGLLERNNLSGEQVNLLIPHQANLRIIIATAKRVNMPMEKVYVNVQNYGNTSSASIPIAIDEAFEKGRLRPHDLCLMVAFGGGFTWGSALIRF